MSQFLTQLFLSLLKLTQICCIDKFAFLFCSSIHKFTASSFWIRFTIRSLSDTFSKIHFRSELICLKMNWKLEMIITSGLIKSHCEHFLVQNRRFIDDISWGNLSKMFQPMTLQGRRSSLVHCQNWYKTISPSTWDEVILKICIWLIRTNIKWIVIYEEEHCLIHVVSHMLVNWQYTFVSYIKRRFGRKYFLWNYVHLWNKVGFLENLKKKYLTFTYFLFE